MIKLVILLATTMISLALAHAVLGYEATYRISYGAFTLMAASISATFAWLWLRRATPLAMGMSLSWAGATGLMGWWWLYHLLETPVWMQESQLLFLLLSVYFVGAILHFEVMARSFGARQWSFLIPIGFCLTASVAIYAVT